MRLLLIAAACLLALLGGATLAAKPGPMPVPYPPPGGPCVTDTPTDTATPPAPTDTPTPACLLTPGSTPTLPTPAGTPGTSWVVEGDSLTVSPWPADAGTLLGGRYPLATNAAQGGDRVHNMLSEAPTQIDPYYRAGQPNIAVLWAGTNDLGLDHAPPAQVAADIANWHAGRRAVGFLTLAATITYRTDLSDTIIDAVNSEIRARWPTYANGMVDLNQDPRLIDPTNLAYYTPDGLHLTEAGQAVVGNLMAAAVEGLGTQSAETRQTELRAGDLALGDGDPVAAWPDASAVQRQVTAPNAGFRPLYRINQHAALPGVVADAAHPMLLQISGVRQLAPHLTLTWVLAPQWDAYGGILFQAPGGFAFWADSSTNGGGARNAALMPSNYYPPDTAHTFGVRIPDDGTLQIVTLTLDGQAAALYLDGQLAGTQTLDFPVSLTADPWLGGDGTGNYNLPHTLYYFALDTISADAATVAAQAAALRAAYQIPSTLRGQP